MTPAVIVVIVIAVTVAVIAVTVAVIAVITPAATFKSNRKMNPKEKELENIQSQQNPSKEVNPTESVVIKQIEDDFEYQEYYSENSPNFDVD
jgi:lipopolysaccharide export LptBFGC system permease protein LptF